MQKYLGLAAVFLTFEHPKKGVNLWFGWKGICSQIKSAMQQKGVLYLLINPSSRYYYAHHYCSASFFPSWAISQQELLTNCAKIFSAFCGDCCTKDNPNKRYLGKCIDAINIQCALLHIGTQKCAIFHLKTATIKILASAIKTIQNGIWALIFLCVSSSFWLAASNY